MIGSPQAWRRMLRFWLPGLLLVVLNLAIVSTYRFLLAGQTQLRSARVGRLSAELDDLEQRRLALQEVLGAADETRGRIQTLHADWLSTEAERLTRVIAEVKELSRRSGIESSSFGYPEEILEEFGLVKRSVVFSVGGSYRALRQFINFIELSEEFLILEEVRLSDVGKERPDLKVDVRLATLFQEREEEPLAADSDEAAP